MNNQRNDPAQRPEWIVCPGTVRVQQCCWTVTDQRGFSLLEILVAVTIMGLAYVAILQNFSMSSRSIVRMDEGRTELMANAIVFERSLLNVDAAGLGEASDAEILAAGGRYQLALVSDENDDFQTLKLQKR